MAGQLPPSDAGQEMQPCYVARTNAKCQGIIHARVASPNICPLALSSRLQVISIDSLMSERRSVLMPTYRPVLVSMPTFLADVSGGVTPTVLRGTCNIIGGVESVLDDASKTTKYKRADIAPLQSQEDLVTNPFSSQDHRPDPAQRCNPK